MKTIYGGLVYTSLVFNYVFVVDLLKFNILSQALLFGFENEKARFEKFYL